jgi:hypothetical protein
MRKAALILFGFFFATASAPAWARQPVVVELFTSQGCSDCVKSGDVLEALPDNPPVLTLTFGVDIWNYLGWSDTFAKPDFTARQRDYMARLGLREVYTPQVVIDGRSETAAVSIDQIEPLVEQAARDQGDAPRVRFRKSRVLVGPGRAPKGGAEVWLVRYEPDDIKVLVKSGENRGKSLVEHHVVRDLVKLGSWSGRERTFDLPPETGGLSTAVLVQGAHGGHIIAVGAR